MRSLRCCFPAVLAILALISLTACDISNPLGTEVQLHFQTSAIENQLKLESASLNALATGNGTATIVQLTGTLTFMSGNTGGGMGGGAVTASFPLNMGLNVDTLEVLDAPTVSIAPGTYNIQVQATASINGSNFAFMAQLNGIVIVDGINGLNITLHPQINPTQVNVAVNPIVDLSFQFTASELASLSNPALGVIIDDTAEQVLLINKTSGSTEAFVSLALGQHTIQLKLYDGTAQVGQSRASEANVTIMGGDIIKMDIVPLNTLVATSFDVATGQGTVSIVTDGAFNQLFVFDPVNLPEVQYTVTDHTGAIQQGKARMSLPPPGSPNSGASNTLSARFVVNASLGQPMALSLDFFSTGPQIQISPPPGPFANCNGDFQFNLSDTAGLIHPAICVINVSPAISSGHLLSEVAIMARDGTGGPIVGASVFIDGVKYGTTGTNNSGVAIPLVAYLIADSHVVRVEGNTGLFGEATVSPQPLQSLSVDIAVTSSTATQ